MSEQNINTLLTAIAFPLTIALIFIGIGTIMYLAYKWFDSKDDELIKLEKTNQRLHDTIAKLKADQPEDIEKLRHSLKNQTAKLHYWKKTAQKLQSK